MPKSHRRSIATNGAYIEADRIRSSRPSPAKTFEAVVAQYVITTVPDPEAALDEFARVTKAGGEIILVHHLDAEAGPRRVFQPGFSPGAPGPGWPPGIRRA